MPNYADIFPGLKDQPWNTVDGVNYGIPHGRGANLLMYSTDKVTAGADSLGDHVRARLAAKGKVSAYDSPIYIADAAVYLMATQPDLGINDPYALDQTQFDAAIALLEQQKPLIGEYWCGLPQADAGLQGGHHGRRHVVAGHRRTSAAADGTPVATVKPKEGATGWSDTWMVAKDTENINCSYKWLDWIVSPEVNAQVAEWFGEAPANEKSCALTAEQGPLRRRSTRRRRTTGRTSTTGPPRPTTASTAAPTCKCVPYSEWVKAWTALRNAEPECAGLRPAHRHDDRSHPRQPATRRDSET